MHQNRCITCCIGAELQINTENIKTLNFYSRTHQVILTIFPTLLSVIRYIYPPTTSLLLSVLSVSIKEEVDG